MVDKEGNGQGGQEGFSVKLDERGIHICRRCNQTLPLTPEFWHRNKNEPSGFSTFHCKDCRAQYDKDRRAASPGQNARYQPKRKYKLSDSALDYLLANGCGICGSFTRKLHIDHDHETGKVRGALCGRCNIGLGIFGDNSAGLLVALAYLEGDL